MKPGISTSRSPTFLVARLTLHPTWIPPPHPGSDSRRGFLVLGEVTKLRKDRSIQVLGLLCLGRLYQVHHTSRDLWDTQTLHHVKVGILWGGLCTFKWRFTGHVQLGERPRVVIVCIWQQYYVLRWLVWRGCLNCWLTMLLQSRIYSV